MSPFHGLRTAATMLAQAGEQPVEIARKGLRSVSLSAEIVRGSRRWVWLLVIAAALTLSALVAVTFSVKSPAEEARPRQTAVSKCVDAESVDASSSNARTDLQTIGGLRTYLRQEPCVGEVRVWERKTAGGWQIAKVAPVKTEATFK